MTTRTLAATAATLPDDSSLDRRTMLATAGAAAVLAAIGTAATGAPTLDADAALLALRQPYEQTLALMDQHSPAHSRAEETYFSPKAAEPNSADRDLRKRSGLTLAERDYNRATDANLKVIHRIAEAPARTLAGLIFKAEVSQREDNMDRDLFASIVAELNAMDHSRSPLRVGFPSCETDLSSSVCAHALAEPDQVLIIPDLTSDPRTCDNPLVTSEPFIRFYAGAPLVTSEGEVLGTLCVIDKVPRPGGLTAEQAVSLKMLARQVMTQLELRRAIVSRDASYAEERRALTARDALRDTQATLAICGSDLDASLYAVVEGAMRAVPAAEGGVVELVDGEELEYRAVFGTLVAHCGLRVPVQGTLAGRCATSHAPECIGDALADPALRQDLIEKVNLRSAVVTPLMRGDAVIGILKLQSSRPDAFTDRDLEAISLFAGAATTGFTEAAAHATARASDIYWRGWRASG